MSNLDLQYTPDPVDPDMGTLVVMVGGIVALTLVLKLAGKAPVPAKATFTAPGYTGTATPATPAPLADIAYGATVDFQVDVFDAAGTKLPLKVVSAALAVPDARFTVAPSAKGVAVTFAGPPAAADVLDDLSVVIG